MPQNRLRSATDRSLDAVSRLYVFWIVSTAMLLLVLLLVIFLLRGELTRQNLAIRGMSDRINQAENQIRQLESGGSAARSGSPAVSPGSTGADALRPGASTTRPTSAATQPAAAAPHGGGSDEAALERELARLLRLGERGRPELSDPAAAAELLDRIERESSIDRYRAPTLARLALLALLTDRSSIAADLARRAESAGQPPLDYWVESVRLALDRGNNAEARGVSERAYERNPHVECRIVYAAALAADGELLLAAQVAETVRDWAALSSDACARLAGVFIELEWWDALEQLMPRVQRLPSSLEPERERIRAVSLVQRGSLTEAIALFEFVLQKSPEDRFSQRWRAIALLRAGQPESARRALLGLAESDPADTQSRYWLGVLAQRAGNVEEARAYWQNCIDLSPRDAAAWEGLGLIALNQGELAAGEQLLTTACESDPRRASAFFLLGLCRAKAGQRDAAADAMRTAIALDVRYLEEARAAEAVRRLFEPREIESLRGEPVSQAVGGEG